MAKSSEGGDDRGLLALWVALAVMSSSLIGSTAGVLGWLSGQVVAQAILTGGIAFGSSLTLLLILINMSRR